MTLLLGCDPGKKGAFALLDTDEITVETFDLPDSISALHDMVMNFPQVKLCALEQIHAGPKMGRRTIGVVFEQFGAIKACLAVRGIPTFTTRPGEWKPSLNIPADKSAARRRASEFFPLNADQWARVKDDGRAEAALIAWYGRKWV